MKLELCVLVAIFTINISQNPTEGSTGNSGVSVKNITRKATNETCQAGGSDCKYFLDLCFSYSPQRNCSIFRLRTLSWVLKPGTSKILHLWNGEITKKVYNPIRVPFERWENEEVVLDVNVSRDDTTDILVDKIQITTKLPCPINEIAKIDAPKHYRSKCGELFCLGVLIYAWCDDIVACAGPPRESSSSVSTRVMYPFNQTSPSSQYPSKTVNQSLNVEPTMTPVTDQPTVRRGRAVGDDDVTEIWWLWVIIASGIVLCLLAIYFVFLKIKRRLKIKEFNLRVEMKKTENDAKQNYGFTGLMKGKTLEKNEQ